MHTIQYTRILFYPTPALRGVVESYCVLRPTAPVAGSIPWHIMPDGASYLLFHVYKASGAEEYTSRLVLVGPRSVYLMTDKKRRVFSFIVRLKPGTSLFNMPVSLAELKDRAMTLDVMLEGDLANRIAPGARRGESGATLHGDPVQAWMDRDLTLFTDRLAELAVKGQTAVVVRLFDAFLAALFDTSIKPPSLATAAIRALDAGQGQQGIGALASSLGVSERHLRNVFIRAVGLSPKRYARIVRLTETVRVLDAGYRYGHARLALSAGYYDQSHMIDEFQALVGESTERFMARTNREDVLMPSSDFSNTQRDAVRRLDVW